MLGMGALLLLLANCAEGPPPAPLAAEPGPGKTAQAFAEDDRLCRVATRAITTATSGYLQCMAGRGNLIASPGAAPAAVTYISYPTAFPWPYFDWGWGFGAPAPASSPAPADGPGAAGSEGGAGPGGGPGSGHSTGD
ncbi:hypothetical protein Acid7E03_09970 [Acidisoma sp. 7E03]